MKSKKGKRRIIILAVILIVFVFFWSIGSSDDSKPDTSSTNKTVAAQKVKEENEENGKINNYTAIVKTSKVSKDYSGDPIIIVTYTFTNNSKKYAAFGYVIQDKLFQNGVELKAVISTYGIDDYDFNNKYKDIKPGVTFDVQSAYYLNDSESPVDVELSDILGLKDPLVTTINIK